METTPFASRPLLDPDTARPRHGQAIAASLEKFCRR